MNKTQFMQKVAELKIIPVFRAESAQQVEFVTEALIEGGLSIIEITMTVAGALEAIQSIKEKFHDKIIVGAGTILDPETARMVILSGAEFIVSPTINASVAETAHRYGKACIMGALTPTEVLKAWELGADVVKVFPCDAMGGPDYIRSLKAPLPQIEMTPSRGIDHMNMAEYLKSGAIAVSAGPKLLDSALIKERKKKELTALIQRYVEIGKS